MAKTSNTYQIASNIEWQDAGEGIVRQIMGYDGEDPICELAVC